MQRAHLFGTDSQTAQPIRTLRALKGREERDGKEREGGSEAGWGGWWLVVERAGGRERKRGSEGTGGGRRGIVCGAGRRHVISQIDKFQSSAKAKSRGYKLYMHQSRQPPRIGRASCRESA